MARIAYEYLQTKNPDIITRAEGILAELGEFTTLEENHPFVECATFPDVIKSKGWGAQSHWHFVDNPFIDDGWTGEGAYNMYNITWALV